MLPGLRFLAMATVVATSVVIFGLGAAALLRASHERFAVLASQGLPQNLSHAPILLARPEAERPVLSLLRVEEPEAESFVNHNSAIQSSAVQNSVSQDPVPQEPVSKEPARKLSLPGSVEAVLPTVTASEAEADADRVVAVAPSGQDKTVVAPASDVDVVQASAMPALPVGPLVTSPAWMEEEQALAVVSEFSPQPVAAVEADARVSVAALAALPLIIASAGEAAPLPEAPSDAAAIAVTKAGDAGDVVEETMIALIETAPLPRSRPDFALLERQRQEAAQQAARRLRLTEQRQRAAREAAKQAALRAQAERAPAPPASFRAPAGFGGFGQFPQRRVDQPR